LVASVLCWLIAGPVRAEVQRFAVIVGNDIGHADDAPLAYAESDADKVYGVLRDLGGFQPIDMVLLKGQDSATVRRTLIAMNDRIRTGATKAGTDSLLVVYYSGHADAGALRLGADRIDLTELSQLVRGSSATFRLMVLDACRSGQLTRVKGGRMIEPFQLPAQAALRGEGLAFLTASAASEDAQESDEIRGSFFTHAFVSGLLGAADVDGDGAVMLDEAYRYAYDATLRATSRTAYGVQHPTFEYDFRGHGSLVLTQPGALTGGRGTLQLPAKLSFLVMQDDGDGAVVAEVAASDSARALSLKAGKYFLRGRGAGFLLEGKVPLTAAETLSVDPSVLERVQYARLVRKGAEDPSWTHAFELGAFGQRHAPGVGASCWGPTFGYSIDLQRLSLGLRLGTCQMEHQNDLLRTHTTEYDASLAGQYVWDFPRLSFAAGLAAGAAIAHQRFETQGSAPNRTSTAPYLAVITNLTVDLHGPIFLRLEARAATEFTTVQERTSVDAKVDVALALRAALLIGVYLSPALPR
jgi:hypothetical protein